MSANRILQKTRVGALTDDIYAVAMTIMAFNLPLPVNTDPAHLSELLMTNVLRDLCIFIGSFIILGTQWVAINFQHGFLVSVDRTYCWLTLGILLLACVVPLSASLLMEFPHEHIVIYIYAGNLLLSQLFQWATMTYSTRNNLNDDPGGIGHTLVLRRVILTPCFYVSGIIIAPYSVTVAFIVLTLPPLFYLLPSALDKYTQK